VSTSALIAIALKPVLMPIFFFIVVAPIAWVLYQLFPDGRAKVVLFRQRSGPGATGRDAVVMCVAVVLAYVLLGCEIAMLGR
jgi:membrane protein required for beta-lactamase induction